MREISPAVNMTADEYLAIMPAPVLELVACIRAQKADGSRKMPSSSLLDRSLLLDARSRTALLDRVAALVDENLGGRADMCQQFAELMQRALAHLGYDASGVAGTAVYFADGREIFRWKHAWVRVGREVIDGNVDSLDENPMVPPAVRVAPYWGPIDQTPRDRRLRQDNSLSLPSDEDVDNIWWPELAAWLDERFGAGA